MVGTTLLEISSFLDNLGFHYSISEENEQIVTGFSTNEYIDRDGDSHLQIVIQIQENGEFIQIFTP